MTKLAILANLERNLVKFVKLVMQKNDMRKVRILRIPTIISANFYIPAWYAGVPKDRVIGLSRKRILIAYAWSMLFYFLPCEGVGLSPLVIYSLLLCCASGKASGS